MFQSKHSRLWRAQAASRNGASSQDAFFPSSCSEWVLDQSLWVCSSHPHVGGWRFHPPVLRQAASVFPLSFLPSLQTPIFTLKPSGIFSFPDKPHQEITGIKDAGQIWKLSFKPQNEWREEITSQLLPPLPA